MRSGDVPWAWVLHSTSNYSKALESSQFPLARSSLFSDKLHDPCSDETNHQHKCRRDIGVTSPHSSCSSLAEILLWAKMGSWHQSFHVTKAPIPKTLHTSHTSLSCPLYSEQQSIMACKKRPGFRRERLQSSPCQFLQISLERATKTWLHWKPKLLNSATLLQILSTPCCDNSDFLRVYPHWQIALMGPPPRSHYPVTETSNL